MSLPLHAEQIASIRDEARILVERASDHEDLLKALIAAAETHVRHAEAALTHALDLTHGCVDRLRSLLCIQLQQSRDGVEAARHLSVGAHEQHVATVRLLTHLDRDQRIDGQPSEQRPGRDAVLVVEDYRDLRDVMATVLRDAGFVVRTAANGLEALLAAYEMRPAVILMDISMPVLDGIEATRLIKAAEATRHARVIAYTGNPVAEDNPARALFASVLQKPTTPAVVLATVQHVANLSERPAEPGCGTGGARQSARRPDQERDQFDGDLPRPVGLVPPQKMALLAHDDEELAGRSTARLLITASAREGVEIVARRIHRDSSRGAFPFVRMRAADFPTEPRLLREICADLVDTARGGTVLIRDVEEMPSIVQELFIDLLTELELARGPSAAVRLICGTTVPLLDRIAAGTFSERLFYRLNVIHLMTGSPRASGSSPVTYRT